VLSSCRPLRPLLSSCRAASTTSTARRRRSVCRLGQLDDLKSAEQINEFLGKLLILVVQNRISARRAAVLTYITNQLLRSLVAITRQLESDPVKLIFDAPRPERDLPESEPAGPSK
jgi:hypothetical protein